MCAMGWLRLVGCLKSCLFCRISSLLQGSFANETYNFKEPTTRSYPIYEASIGLGLDARVLYDCGRIWLFGRVMVLFCGVIRLDAHRIAHVHPVLLHRTTVPSHGKTAKFFHKTAVFTAKQPYSPQNSPITPQKSPIVLHNRLM